MNRIPQILAAAATAMLATTACVCVSVIAAATDGWTETEGNLCPDGALARDYEGAEFVVGDDRVRPDWGTYEPWTCLEPEPTPEPPTLPAGPTPEQAEPELGSSAPAAPPSSSTSVDSDGVVVTRTYHNWNGENADLPQSGF